MKKWLIIGISAGMLLSGCAPQFDNKQEVVNDTKTDKEETAIIPKFQISDDYYQAVFPFKTSKARGLTVANINTRQDLVQFETGLMRLSHEQFPTDNYVFREGQSLDKETIKSWLNRQYTEAQLKENKMSASENVGLNPVDTGKGDIEKRSKESPIYLAQILEQNYLIKSEDNKYKLGGVSIGLALNSVYYYTKEKYGAEYNVDIKDAVLEEQGKKMAQEIVKRLRAKNELKDVPIMISLFKQESKDSVVPGNFIAYTNVDGGSMKLGNWKDVDEKYYLLPSSAAEKAYRPDNTSFQNFKQDIEEYFPNFNGVVGQAHYVDGQLNKLSVSIQMQFYGKTETISFTQYVAELVMEHFPEHLSVEVNISSVNGQESLITREPNQAKPYVHIYQ